MYWYSFRKWRKRGAHQPTNPPVEPPPDPPVDPESYLFPKHVTYTAGTIKPSIVTQTQMDNQVKSFYDKWKTRYLKQPANAADQYYVDFGDTSEDADTDKGDTVSEAHGYGMMITAYMNGYDANAKTVFDGMVKYYDAHRSTNNTNMMAWLQERNASGVMVNVGGTDSATDGDMDIAFALLLADKQWGSAGTINYKQKALTIINSLMDSCVNQTEWILRLGDWEDGSNSTYANSTRSSDWMINHLRAFKTVTNDSRWDSVINKIKEITTTIQTNNSPNTGLLPDFIQKQSGVYKPAPENFLESATDNDYSYNACRVPWRFGVDCLLSGDITVKAQINKLNGWAKAKMGSNPDNFVSGYQLNGTAVSGVTWSDIAFIAPLAVSAMVDSSHQAWLDLLWTRITTDYSDQWDIGYYNDSILMLCLIAISGNWWTI